jgi:hypothetical protein
MLPTVTDCALLHLQSISDRSGNITPALGGQDIPFAVSRVFYLYGIPGDQMRGAHAHRRCHQFLVAANGTFEVILDDGSQQQLVLLNRPNLGLHIPPGIWASQVNFSAGAVCLVLASEAYVEADYVRDYQQFLDWRSLPTQ